MRDSRRSAHSQTPPDNAGIYSTKKVPPLKTLLSSLAPTAKIAERRDGQTNTVSCEWSNVTVTIIIDGAWDGPVQRSGMKGWISRFPTDETKTPAVAAFTRKIDSTVDCLGCVITPRYDAEGKAASLLLGLAGRLEGFVFSHDTFYDTTGTKIIGLPGNPAKLQTRK